MEYNFFIVLFKNKIKQRIIKKFITQENCLNYFDKEISKSNSIIFNKKFENGFQCDFELAVVTHKKNTSDIIYNTDELGRRIKVVMEDDDLNILKISPYNKEELIFDSSNNTKIDVNTFIKKYLNLPGLKLLSRLNNKVVLQIDDSVWLFSLKNEFDSDRLLDTLQKKFTDEGKFDCIIVKDCSVPQKKFLYSLLSEKGFSKSYLFRQVTTFPTKK